jgi:hypothetical protein
MDLENLAHVVITVVLKPNRKRVALGLVTPLRQL